MASLFALADLAAWLSTTEPELDPLLAEQVRSKTTALVGGEVRIPDPVPAELASVAASIGARLYDNPLGYTNESFAGYSAGYAQAVLTADEKAAIKAAVGGGSVRGAAGSSLMRTHRDLPRRVRAY
jgi:hypothetical protein